ncbi:MAG: 50S ribosomal protein L13 [Patescibacteria group bacterium]|jgi:large subunit ribosomal protein L13
MPRTTYTIDASGKVLGRLATDIALHLMGKYKTSYVPNIDDGDIVIITNAKDVKITGKKLDQKIYIRHTQYPGGIRERKMSVLMQNDPKKVIEMAVSRMLPKNNHRDRRMERLTIS